MKKILTILLIVLFASPVMADSVDIKIDKYEVNPNKKQRHLKAKIVATESDSRKSELALYAWGEECYFKIILPKVISKSAIHTDSLNGEPSIKFPFGSDTAYFYSRDDGFEWEVIFADKPAQNIITLPIVTQGLKFLYQPELSPSDTDSYRPDSVVGSYAVYHSSRKNNVTKADGTEEHYTTGKAFHIYRPKAWDAAHDTVWCDLLIDTVAGEIELTIPKAWIRNATYPVVVDPTFGKTAIGGTNGNWYDGYVTACRHTADAAGDVDYAVWYCLNDAVAGVYRLCCFTNTNGINEPDSNRAVGDEIAQPGYAPHWDSVAVSTVSFTSGDTLWCAGWVNTSNLLYKYDASDANDSTAQRDSHDPAPSVNEEWGLTGNKLLHYISSYINYTESGAAAAPNKRRRVILMGQ